MAAMAYQWKANGYLASSKFDAQKIGARLDALGKKNGGELTPEQIVADAKPVNSPMHSFIWADSDSDAAHKHRLQLARVLVANIVVIRADGAKEKNGEPKMIRSFVSVPATKETGPRTYQEITTVLSDSQKRGLVVAEALSRLTGWRERYDGLAEFSEVYTAIDKVAAKRKGKAA